MRRKNFGPGPFYIGGLIIVLVIVGLVIGNKLIHTANIDGVITDESEFEDLLVNNALKYKRKINFKTTVNPETMNYNPVFTRIYEADSKVGCEVYAYSFVYEYDPLADVNKVEFNIKSLGRIKAFLTGLRVKQIARHINKKCAGDYDKVKAVHDYLIMLNQYDWCYGGAFNTLYLRSAACNGYAYSFYAIMKELGIPATCEYSTDHEWNSVLVDGKWYNIDVTWDDYGKSVGYEYFLKCDADWEGHPFGSSDANESLPVTGMSAKENYRIIPNYRIFVFIILLALLVAVVTILPRQVQKSNNKRELLEIEKELEEKEKLRKEAEANREKFINGQ